MTRLPAHLQHLTEGLPANRKADIEEAILSSPLLQQRMTEEVQAGRLQHVRLQSSGEHSGGHYSRTDRSIYMDPDSFTELKTKTERLDRITYVLGHETAHSALSEGSALSSQALSDAVHGALWTESDLEHLDLTAPAGRYLQYARQDESMATIAAWNALADRIDHERSGPLLQKDLLKRVAAIGDCVVGLENNRQLAPGITLNAQQRIMIGTPLTESANLEAVGVCYYDKPAQETKLGRNGNSDYTNHYGTTVIENIAANVRSFETSTGQRAPQIGLDLDQLGLKRAQLEHNGLDLGGQNFGLLDTSHGRRQGISLKSDTSTEPEGPNISRATAQQPTPPLMSQPGHPAHLMWTQAMHALHNSPNIPAGTFTQHEEQQVAASLVAQSLSKDNPFKTARIDHVVLSQDGTSLFAVHGGLSDPAQNLAQVNVQQALSTPIKQSSDIAKTALLTREQALLQEQQLMLSLQQDAPTGPVMRIGARTMHPAGGPSADSGGEGGE